MNGNWTTLATQVSRENRSIIAKEASAVELQFFIEPYLIVNPCGTDGTLESVSISSGMGSRDMLSGP